MLHTKKNPLLKFILLTSSISLFASPKLVIEKTTHDCGILTEGKENKIKASFIIKNDGNEDLKIEKVRPGCGCTVVKYDSIIAPGKTGSIKPEVDIRGFSGKIKKSVTINSNDPDNPLQRIYITAEIKPTIDISTRYITLNSSVKKQPEIFYLSSLKTDLNIKNLSFKPFGNNGPAWQNQISFPIEYDWIATDSIRSDNFSVFKLSLIPPDTIESLNGVFILDPNPPDNMKIRIKGRILK